MKKRLNHWRIVRNKNCRRDYRYKKAKDILQEEGNCYIKEKRGRMDTSYRGDTEGIQYRLMNEVEMPSEDHCQYCNRGGKQFRMDYGRVIHLCRRCMIKDKIYLFIRKLQIWRNGRKACDE